jgi:geranylgeranyl diphosphate synthase type II
MPRPAAAEADSAEVKTYLRLQQRRVDAKLENLMPPADTYPEVVHEAMRYSLFAGGKRVRPALALATAEALDGDAETSLQLACALELIHTYSLIHDDLPAMDDDDYRRGLPTAHRKFGEGIAILAGNGLMTLAFRLLSELPGAAVPDSVRLQVITHLCRSIGTATGLIGGQVMDLVSQGKAYTEEEVRYIHSCKTGALIEASVSTAALLCGAPRSARQSLSSYARQVGLCFQIVDDLLDVEGSQEELGKGSQKDVLLEKATYPALLGVPRSHEIADRLMHQATREVSFLGSRARMLIGIAAFISSRRY